MNKLNIALTLTLISACNVKGVECSQEDVSCIKTDVNSDVDVSETNTTVNNTIVNNSGGSGGSNNDSSGGSAGSESGLSGSGGSSGGDTSSDAGTGDSGASVPLVCDSPASLPNDVRNWFATTSDAVDWFQLTTADGFSEDRCTYTGKFRWFYEGPDGYWESDRQYDIPVSTITIEFTTDGFVKGNYHSPTEVYPNGYVVTQDMKVNNCYAGVPEGSILRFDATYGYYNCLKFGGGNHPRALYVFRGTWVDDQPTMTQQVYPPNSG